MTTEHPDTTIVALRIVEGVLQRLPLEQLLSGTTAPIRGDAVAIGQKFGELYQGVLEKVRGATASDGKPSGNGHGRASEVLTDTAPLSILRRPLSSPPTGA